MVADVIRETADTTTLVLFTGNDRLEYRPGHFLTIDPHQFEALERFIDYLEDLKGRREPPRAYSLASAPHEKRIAVTVKEERYLRGQTRYPPLLSPLLVKRTPRGTHMAITGFTGPYTLPEDLENRTDHVVHICAGSGIVPNFSMIKSDLAVGTKVRHTVVYSNKTWDDVIFRDELVDLERAHPQRLRVLHTLTRQDAAAPAGPGVRRGRASLELVREALRDPSADRVYVCGPAISPWDRKSARETGTEPAPRFLETVLGYLSQLGVPEEQVRQESYG